MSTYYIICIAVFMAAYLINITYISIFYHRGLTHDAIKLSPGLRRFVVMTGSWVTGIDPKAWCCMHRMHHVFSDTEKDPHSPLRWGLFGTAFGQLRSYNATLRGLMRKDAKYTKFVPDFEFGVNWLNRKKLWMAPYLFHLTVWLIFGFGFDSWLLGYAYFAGMMTHPIQGWLVNSFGHAMGYRNFDISDNSRNNTIVAWLVFGEGFQNNHHRYPRAAKFSMRWFEVDLGYAIAWSLAALGFLSIPTLSHAELDEPHFAQDLSSESLSPRSHVG
jgi:stearoyl-CoA desaturase (delta-9 desaturase)